ncbi:MAG: methyltransferase domain-containing protein [Euryarchaeota archaeon]|nr:methyltransferase domain-containing protein [Euryarchaeota archaeon]
MRSADEKHGAASNMVTFYHDIEQDIDSEADPGECRKVVKEFLELEKRYDVPATYNIVGRIFQEQPSLIECILREGQEVAFHSYNHQSDWQPPYYSDEIDLCRKASPIPCGYRSPRSQWDRNTLKTLWERGFLWNAECDTHKEPYFIHNGLVRLPIATDDWLLHTGDMDVDEWVKQFPVLLKSRPYFGFGSHDYITSFAPKDRLKAWERVLQMAVENEVLMATFSEAADLFRRAKVSRYYSSTARDWNRGTKTLYRTKRFQELIRGEAERLNQPVVVDLGSAGGVLSLPLQDIAKKIYLIDNAPGMVGEVSSNGRIRACQGDVTESNLPDRICDFVICARIIEYLFWPDRLADEIKRIGRIGATYLVTFPAFRETLPPHAGPAPDRIRRYFTPDEIRKWADRIGPGSLTGIQYEVAEPDSPETEERYRAIEKDQPPNAYPTNWVYIGSIENDPATKRNKKTIPVSAFDFRFQGDRYERIRMCMDLVKRHFPKPILRLGKLVKGL